MYCTVCCLWKLSFVCMHLLTEYISLGLLGFRIYRRYHSNLGITVILLNYSIFFVTLVVLCVYVFLSRVFYFRFTQLLNISLLSFLHQYYSNIKKVYGIECCVRTGAKLLHGWSWFVPHIWVFLGLVWYGYVRLVCYTGMCTAIRTITQLNNNILNCWMLPIVVINE
jgi:hypothetical protein